MQFRQNYLFSRPAFEGNGTATHSLQNAIYVCWQLRVLLRLNYYWQSSYENSVGKHYLGLQLKFYVSMRTLLMFDEITV